MTGPAKSYASIQVIDRAVQLLDAVATGEDAVSLKVLAADTGLPTSTAFRILAALESHGLVGRDVAGRYILGARLLRYGNRVRERLDLRHEARPILEGLRAKLGETVNLTVPEGDDVVYVERATVAKKMMRVENLIGSRAPLHVTAVGKLFLAERGPQASEQYVRLHGLAGLTANTITDLQRLHQEVEAARRDGYAVDNEEAEIGVGCYGAPVRDASGAVVAALSVSAPIERRRAEWIPELKQAAARLSERLGYYVPTSAD